MSRAAELTGVPSATLRKWEQRYDIVEPTRTKGNYRLYDDEALRRLAAMRDLVEAGWSARDAAARVKQSLSGAAEGSTSRDNKDLVELTRVAATFDAVGLETLLDRRFSEPDLDFVVDTWLMPSLIALGEAWAQGEVTVAGEHFVSAAVHRRLARAFDEAPDAPPESPHVLVGLARGSRHELGILAFGAILRAHDVAVTYLGADLPLESWTAAARAVSPDVVVVSVPTVEDLPAVRELVAALSPLGQVLLGGSQQHRLPDVEPLGHAPGAAARDLAERLYRAR